MVEAVGVYLITYSVTTLGAFGVVGLMSSPRGERDADNLYDYRGLFWRRPLLVAILTPMMLSLAGIPITEGWSPHPREVVKTGDWVRVDPGKKLIEVLKRAP